MTKLTLEMVNLALMYLDSTSKPIKKIKVTSKFADYLKQTCHHAYLSEDISASNGVVANFTGVPLVVDDTISSDYYELVF